MDRRVAASRCAEYGAEAVEKALERAMALAPPPDARGKIVLLKPNALMGARPEKAVSTHPEILRAAIRAFRAAGASRIMVGESPGYQSMESAAIACGLSEVIESEGAEMATFSRGVAVDNPRGSLVKSFEFASEWELADLVVSLPKLKTHSLLRYTGAIKNLFGLVPGFAKAAFHFRFPEISAFSRMIADMALCADADYAIMDAVIGMEGPGPGSGDPREIGLILASANLLALDRVACRIIGYDPDEIGYLAEARESGNWLSPGEDAELVGEALADIRVHGFKLVHKADPVGFQKWVPAPLRALARAFMVPRPLFNHKKCLRCSACIGICPAKALSYAADKSNARYGKRIAIDYGACIRCYCCHEICPADAISLRRRA
jgi:uncharacterized protein (DUF362 family)/Pyruvate/2-oxoacid:ferredoxin oxidoreductase delta subunit